ncbi:sigma-54-dependent transcriptional regulator [Oceanirhabdus seepicola]|uniref:Stage 0 sporulation protein A homolog n=1 Tax=Oceanirhabdus seepicola TaxID=2828781 RepID=A0A9J6P6U1_9CLOT|nr:sigma-54 dependent transcriptional regulator [Oceanirhabdus seepicola]MCM1991216.1 sigma-54-dependent Fis family transcriptional regulator [Oceanirhabdus seepicola]
MKKIYIVDDHEEISDLLKKVLEKENYNTTAFYDAYSVIEAVKADCPDLVLLDIQMPNMDGVEVLKNIKKLHSNIKVIIMTAYAEKQKSNFFFENGAVDFISKPFKLKDIRNIVSNVLSGKKMNNKEFLKEKGKVIGESAAIKKCINKALKLSNSDAPIMILGESGTGKEVLVDYIHYNSIRKHNGLIKINCAAIPCELLESELFGYDKGAFTGASVGKIGKIEAANEGTLFLDEICELDIKLQTKLLRILEYKTFERLGGNKQIESDFRIVCATNKDILKEVEEGRFREDLFYRINTFNINVPSLRERRDDIPLLVQHFIQLFRRDYVTIVKHVSDEVMDLLMKHNWPGNIRELKNVVQRMISIAREEVILREDLPSYLLTPKIESVCSRQICKYKMLTIEEVERHHIKSTLQNVNGDKKDAIKILGISEKTLYNKIKKYNMKL